LGLEKDFSLQHIESLWSELKSLTKQSQGAIIGCGFDKKEGIQHYIDVGIWRQKNKRQDLVQELCSVINLMYP